MDNSSILIVVIIAGAIVAIKLDKQDSQTEALIAKLIDELRANKPA